MAGCTHYQKRENKTKYSRPARPWSFLQIVGSLILQCGEILWDMTDMTSDNERYNKDNKDDAFSNTWKMVHNSLTFLHVTE